MIEHLRESIASVQYQISLFRWSPLWYLMPLALSLVLIFIDRLRSGRVHFDIAMQRRDRGFFRRLEAEPTRDLQDLEPRLRELEKTLRELEAQEVDRQNT